MRNLLLVVALLAACDAAPAAPDDMTSDDLANVGDLASSVDLSLPDLSSSVDPAQPAPDLSTPDVLQCHGGSFLFDFSTVVVCRYSLTLSAFFIEGNKPSGSGGQWLDKLALSFDDSLAAPIACDAPPLNLSHRNVVEAISASASADLRTDASDMFGGGSGTIDTLTLAPVGGRVRGTFHATIYQFPVPSTGTENIQTFTSCVFDCARTADQ